VIDGAPGQVIAAGEVVQLVADVAVGAEQVVETWSASFAHASRNTGAAIRSAIPMIGVSRIMPSMSRQVRAEQG
jgi:hypothetical protein